jgi:hypothetical protein
VSWIASFYFENTTREDPKIGQKNRVSVTTKAVEKKSKKKWRPLFINTIMYLT